MISRHRRTSGESTHSPRSNLLNDWLLPALIGPLIFSVVALMDKRVLSEFRLPLPPSTLFVGTSQGVIGTVVLLASPGEGLQIGFVLAAMSIGITQGIGAYQAEYNGHKITFIDTPGHAAHHHCIVDEQFML